MRAFIQSLGTLLCRARSTSRKGQTLVEYALILAVITVVAIGVFAQLGNRITLIFSAINSLLDTAQSSH